MVSRALKRVDGFRRLVQESPPGPLVGGAFSTNGLRALQLIAGIHPSARRQRSA
ncbi:hypothetical protein SAMN00790413_04227 [Deinococcus hopiensis KR-140]|uniref:Uncharacterized protein n=1 Tax=Deinococcus hopiensis KR-140 TaxID=695939 RepID=A0A1W1UQP1_9DEIO|nr:hypothetical protein SAMN00790413_04227 [Deinococcus hopiensis KR-140]